MGDRHSPEDAGQACPVKLDEASLKGWRDLARRHDEGAIRADTGTLYRALAGFDAALHLELPVSTLLSSFPHNGYADTV